MYVHVCVCISHTAPTTRCMLYVTRCLPMYMNAVSMCTYTYVHVCYIQRLLCSYTYVHVCYRQRLQLDVCPCIFMNAVSMCTYTYVHVYYIQRLLCSHTYVHVCYIQRLQPAAPPPPDVEWKDDGMQWKKFCGDVVEEMALNPEMLDQVVRVCLYYRLYYSVYHCLYYSLYYSLY